ncbi:MAG TPA: hypothetical protein VJZ71_17860 [Phycisphaerae bacterium]|nr:hypothetical protein [Phycisphaerae bacterium]
MKSRITLGKGCACFLAGLCLAATLGGVRGTYDVIVATPVGADVDVQPSGGELPVPPPPAVTTSQFDYAPGTNVEIAGSAFAAGGNVTLSVSHLSRTCTCGAEAHRSWTVVADASGSFVSNWALSPTATGPDVLALVAISPDGTRAETLFTSNLTGAIWTTDQCGATVNHNVYGSCEPPNPLVCDPKSPFLNGGPQNHNCGFAGGLPDGDFYFQVTDPSGMVLLSNDGIEHRQVHVECGVITEYANLPDSVASHVVGTGFCPAHDACAASISVALWPFDPTPNPGGEYKCWITRVSDYDESDPQANFGFRESESKTDNYKCARQPGTGACCLACAGHPDTYLDECRSDVTEADCQAMGGAYHADETCPGDTCGECPQCTITIRKYYDANANGENDAEIPLDGVQVEVCFTPMGGLETCVTLTSGTDGPGQASVVIPSGSSITVCELLPTTGVSNCNWIQTEPKVSSPNSMTIGDKICYSMTLPDTVGCTQTLPFGNVCICAPSTGRTLGFWSNKNGKNILSSKDSAWRDLLNALCLRNASGADYDVPGGMFADAYTNFRTWLLDANAVNMACMLSAQLTATKLDIAYMGMNAGDNVLLPDDLADCYGAPMANIGAVVAAADAALCADGLTPSGDEPSRSTQECLKDILDGVNNNGLPVISGEPCDVVYP